MGRLMHGGRREVSFEGGFFFYLYWSLGFGLVRDFYWEGKQMLNKSNWRIMRASDYLKLSI